MDSRFVLMRFVRVCKAQTRADRVRKTLTHTLSLSQHLFLKTFFDNYCTVRRGLIVAQLFPPKTMTFIFPIFCWGNARHIHFWGECMVMENTPPLKILPPPPLHPKTRTILIREQYEWWKFRFTFWVFSWRLKASSYELSFWLQGVDSAFGFQYLKCSGNISGWSYVM